MMRRGGQRAAVAALLSLLAASLVGSSAVAQTPPDDPAVDFVVTPSRLELRAAPGDRIRAEVKVYNRAEDTLRLDAYVEDIELAPNDLIGRDEMAFTASRWVGVDHDDLEIPAGAQDSVMITADIPPGTPTGGYHAFGFLQSRPPDGATNILPSGRIGVTLLLEVAPEGAAIERSARVSDSALDVHWRGVFSPVVEARTVVDNTGDVHVMAGGVHTYRSWPGASSEDEKVGPHTILRGARHTFQSSWDAVPLFGKVTVTSEIVYQVGPDDLPVIVTQHTVWIIPWHLIGGILALMVLVIVVRRRRRSAGRDTSDNEQGITENHEDEHDIDEHAPAG